MKLRSALVFVVLGAILRFAVTVDVNWIDIQTFGLIFMLVGVFGLLLLSYRTMLALSRRRREPLGPAFAELGEGDPYKPEQPDPTLVSEIENAHQLAQEARPFLEAEGYTSQRVGELALAFAAKDVGWSTEEFIDWALAQGRLGQDPSVDV
ncbi:MAG TPA: hypothetical protein VFA46_05665 [Actinomycetes bacterium]|jgi:hypothetical protein|nr:hypothetical protein [Actinomycetes bacterium]